MRVSVLDAHRFENGQVIRNSVHIFSKLRITVRSYGQEEVAVSTISELKIARPPPSRRGRVLRFFHQIGTHLRDRRQFNSPSVQRKNLFAFETKGENKKRKQKKKINKKKNKLKINGCSARFPARTSYQRQEIKGE